MSQITTKWHDKIAIVTFTPDSTSMNILDEATLKSFKQTVDEILQAKDLAGIILTSSHDTFIAGVDLNMLGNMIKDTHNIHHSRNAMISFVLDIDNLFRKLEQAPCPVVAAISGTCLGGGYELCLATHHRMMVNNCESRIGLPECKLGIFPGLGGSVRLTRYLGVEKALRVIIQGQTLSPEKAKKIGVIDTLCDDHVSMIKQAILWCQENPNAKQPWDMEKYRVPGGLPYTKQGMMTWSPACAIAKSQTHDLYPGIREVLSVIYNGLLTSFDDAIVIEAKSFVRTLLTPQAQRMIKTLFIARQQIRNQCMQAPVSKKSLQLAVVGTGFMGQGIATAFAEKGHHVILVDQSESIAKSAQEKILEHAQEQVEKGRKAKSYQSKIKKNIKIAADMKSIKDANLVIEAVAEDLSIKAKVLKQVCKHVSPECLITSNTSTLPIADLAESVKRPERFCGMHFFSPVARMQLIEVIPSESTSQETINTIKAISCKISKTPITVSDCRGFFVNQVLLSYMEQAFEMLHEGVPAYLIERAALAIGMPVGPLTLADEVGVDIIWHIFESFKTEKISPQARETIDYLYKNKRFGKKCQAGFYNYDQKKSIWIELDVKYRKTDQKVPFQDIKDRLFIIQIMKSLTCFDLGVVEQPIMADYAAIFGWGFCPWTGGPFRYLDDVHRSQFKRRCQHLAELYSDAFIPSDILDEWVEDENFVFYGQESNHVS